MNIKSLLLFMLTVAISMTASAAVEPTDVVPRLNQTVAYASDFTNVQLKFGTAVTVDNSQMPTLTNNTTGEVQTASQYFYWQMAWDYMGEHTIKIVFEAPKSNGEYTLTVPAGTITKTRDGSVNEELTYTWTLKDNDLNEVTYETIEMVSTTPEQNATVMNLGGDYEFHFNTTNNSAVNFLTWEFWDMSSSETETLGQPVLMRQNNRNRYTLDGNMLASNTKDQWTNDITFFVGGSDPLYEGKEYEMRVKFYAMGLTPADVAAGTRNTLPAPYEYEKSLVCEYTIKIQGGTKPYEFSDVTFTVSPDPEEYVIENPNLGVFTFTFSAPVDVTTFNISLGDGKFGDGGEMTSNDDDTVWILTLDPTQVQACLDDNSNIFWNMGANDKEGRRVRGNDSFSAGANSITSYLTRCDNTTPKLVLVSPVDDADGYVPELTKIIVTNERGIEMRASAASANLRARLLNRQGAEIVVFTSFEINPDNNSQVIFTLPTPITNNGSYVFMIPADMFLIMNGGEQGFSYSLAFDKLFQVKSGATVVKDFIPLTVTPTHGTTVQSISKVHLVFDSQLEFVPGADNTVSFYHENNLVEQKRADFDWDDFTLGKIEFEKEYTTAGKYEVVIPEGVFCNEDYINSNGEYGRINPELRYNYTIQSGGTSGVVDIEASEEDCADVYGIDGTVVRRAASRADLNTLPAGIYIYGREKVVVK